MVNDPTNNTEGERRQAYLRCVCATLNFDVGEIWSWRNEDHDSSATGDSNEDDGDSANDGPMRFIQLYTSPSFRNQRSKLVTPSEDWEESHIDVSKHKFSPLICEAVRDGGGVVWANTEVQEGLLGRSDLPLRTAVGAPIYTQGRELGVLVLFSPSIIQNSASTMEFLGGGGGSGGAGGGGGGGNNGKRPIGGSNRGGGESLGPERRFRRKRNIPELGFTRDTEGLPVLDSDEYSLWAAFMRPDSPPGSPSPAEAFPLSGAKDDGVNEGEGERNHQGGKGSRAVGGLATLSPFRPQDVARTGWSTFVGAAPQVVSSGSNGRAIRPQLNRSCPPPPPPTRITSSPRLAPPSAFASVCACRNAPSSAGEGVHPLHQLPDPQKRNRFDEFVTGFLSMSLFQAADVWLPLGKRVSRLFLYSSNVQDPALVKWSSLSRNVVLASGVGLPGIVFQERRPQWAVDYSQVDPERNPLASVARLLGIGSAFGVPLSLGTADECGVLMLYSMSCLPPSELMVEFMERATRLLLADAPAPTVLLQQFRENPPSATDIGRVAGAYQHHALWAEHHVRSNGNSSSSGSKKRSGGGGGGSGSAVHNLFSQHSNGNNNNTNNAITINNARSPTGPIPASAESDTTAAAAAATAAKQALARAAVAADEAEEASRRAQQQAGSGRGAGGAGAVRGGEGGGRGGGGGGRGRKDSSLSGARGGGRASAPAPAAEPPSLSPPSSSSSSSSSATAVCRAPGCRKAPNGRTPFCWDHWSAARQCQHAGCDKLSQGNTRLCIAHGGGRRCTHPGCNKGARDRFFCAAHGGGKRCGVAECGKAAVGGSDLCTGHGGGKRCQSPNCPKSAQSKTNFCVRHGGGRKCSVPGCLKVARGRTSHCAAHGGGVRCCVESCNKAAVGRERMCRSHQRRSKNASAAAGAGGAAPSAGSASGSASRSRSPSPSVGSSSLLSAFSGAASSRQSQAPTAAKRDGVTIQQHMQMEHHMRQQIQQQMQNHLSPSSASSFPGSTGAAAAAAVAATATIRGVSSYGGGGRKRSAAMAMAGGGPADEMGVLRGSGGGGSGGGGGGDGRGGAGGHLSFRLPSSFPPC
ncbi:unnamed protein product [Scytosiphon promiscuus]